MGTLGMLGMIVGATIVLFYSAVAILFILQCETTKGTVWATVGAVGIGAVIAYFIESLIPIAICGLALLTICGGGD